MRAAVFPFFVRIFASATTSASNFCLALPFLPPLVKSLGLEVSSKGKPSFSKVLACILDILCCVSRNIRPKAVWHGVHSYGRSPVCLLMCLLRLLFRKKPLEHTVHTNFRSSESCWVWLWLFSCTSRLPLRLKVLGHWVHLNSCLGPCMR